MGDLWTSQVGYTALMLAAANGHHDVTGLLLDRGADMEAKTKVDWTFHPARGREGSIRPLVG